MLTALTVGINDPTGEMGVGVDLAVNAEHGLLTTCVVTSTHSINEVYPLPRSIVGGQLAMALHHSRPAAVKVETLASPDAVSEVAGRARAGELPRLVVDPDLSCAMGGHRGMVGAFLGLLPLAEVATPNLDEAAALLGWPVSTPADMAGAAAQLAARGCSTVVITGGLLGGDEAIDVLWTDAGARFLKAPRLALPPGCGTGSMFSAAVTAGLALGRPAPEAVAMAKEYVVRFLTAAVRRDDPYALPAPPTRPTRPVGGGNATPEPDERALASRRAPEQA
ncbi:MAG TPA: PfkB family carbohydrate kinase [Micromonosporaceae bacterium]|jgi:hydroxymethylpyrimidine kinase/phosphomethylpyrimidine kinase